MNKPLSSLFFILLTPIFFILALWVSVFPHEYAHSTIAWLYGFKANPFAIHYGQLNWQNVIFVSGIDEHVNYFLMYLLGDSFAMGLAAFAGPGIATVAFYFLSLFLLHCQTVKKHPYLFYFICWVNIFNLAELISYTILRSFSTHDDTANFISAWGISPWYVFIIGGCLLTIALWHFLTSTLIELYFRMHLNISEKCFILIIFAFILFGLAGIRVFLEPNSIFVTSLGALFCIMTLILTIICWPTRAWVKRKLRAV